MLSGNGCFIGGSHIGSKVEVLEMLEVAKAKGVKSWIQVLDSTLSFSPSAGNIEADDCISERRWKGCEECV